MLRFYKINQPDQVVYVYSSWILPSESRTHRFISFDEVHFGKFASYYILRQYYFDVHPPFAKLLFGLAGWFVGFDGHFSFENIGDSYTENHVPYVGMRALPAILSSLTIPVVYAIMKETGYSTIVAAFSASIILFGTCIFSASVARCIRIYRLQPRQCTHCAVSTHSSRRYPYILHVPHNLLICAIP